jgi:hypothetical protein
MIPGASTIVNDEALTILGNRAAQLYAYLTNVSLEANTMGKLQLVAARYFEIFCAAIVRLADT